MSGIQTVEARDDGENRITFAYADKLMNFLATTNDPRVRRCFFQCRTLPQCSVSPQLKHHSNSKMRSSSSTEVDEPFEFDHHHHQTSSSTQAIDDDDDELGDFFHDKSVKEVCHQSLLPKSDYFPSILPATTPIYFSKKRAKKNKQNDDNKNNLPQKEPHRQFFKNAKNLSGNKFANKKAEPLHASERREERSLETEINSSSSNTTEQSSCRIKKGSSLIRKPSFLCHKLQKCHSNSCLHLVQSFKRLFLGTHQLNISKAMENSACKNTISNSMDNFVPSAKLGFQHAQSTETLLVNKNSAAEDKTLFTKTGNVFEVDSHQRLRSASSPTYEPISDQTQRDFISTHSIEVDRRKGILTTKICSCNLTHFNTISARKEAIELNCGGRRAVESEQKKCNDDANILTDNDDDGHIAQPPLSHDDDLIGGQSANPLVQQHRQQQIPHPHRSQLKVLHDETRRNNRKQQQSIVVAEQQHEQSLTYEKQSVSKEAVSATIKEDKIQTTKIAQNSHILDDSSEIQSQNFGKKSSSMAKTTVLPIDNRNISKILSKNRASLTPLSAANIRPIDTSPRGSLGSSTAFQKTLRSKNFEPPGFPVPPVFSRKCSIFDDKTFANDRELHNAVQAARKRSLQVHQQLSHIELPDWSCNEAAAGNDDDLQTQNRHTHRKYGGTIVLDGAAKIAEETAEVIGSDDGDYDEHEEDDELNSDDSGHHSLSSSAADLHPSLPSTSTVHGSENTKRGTKALPKIIVVDSATASSSDTASSNCSLRNTIAANSSSASIASSSSPSPPCLAAAMMAKKSVCIDEEKEPSTGSQLSLPSSPEFPRKSVLAQKRQSVDSTRSTSGGLFTKLPRKISKNLKKVPTFAAQRRKLSIFGGSRQGEQQSKIRSLSMSATMAPKLDELEEAAHSQSLHHHRGLSAFLHLKRQNRTLSGHNLHHQHHNQSLGKGNSGWHQRILRVLKDESGSTIGSNWSAPAGGFRRRGNRNSKICKYINQYQSLII